MYSHDAARVNQKMSGRLKNSGPAGTRLCARRSKPDDSECGTEQAASQAEIKIGRARAGRGRVGAGRQTVARCAAGRGGCGRARKPGAWAHGRKQAHEGRAQAGAAQSAATGNRMGARGHLWRQRARGGPNLGTPSYRRARGAGGLAGGCRARLSKRARIGAGVGARLGWRMAGGRLTRLRSGGPARASRRAGAQQNVCLPTRRVSRYCATRRARGTGATRTAGGRCGTLRAARFSALSRTSLLGTCAALGPPTLLRRAGASLADPSPNPRGLKREC